MFHLENDIMFCRINICQSNDCRNGFDASVSQLNSFLPVQKDCYVIETFFCCHSDALVHFVYLAYS